MASDAFGDSHPQTPAPVRRFLPAAPDAGFYQDDHHAWCGSPIRVGDGFHLFASRWPVGSGFPDGYRGHSQIVQAVAASPLGPYRFEQVVLAGRGDGHWDGRMCHNPRIVRVGERFVLFYIGTAVGSRFRQIGYATAPAIDGPWTRCEAPIPLGDDANNPAPLVHSDGRVMLAFRDETLHMHVAEAAAFDAPYRVIARDILPGIPIEDADLSFRDGRYEMVVEDNLGRLTGHVRFGARLVSDDGRRWRKHEQLLAYTHTIEQTGGGILVAQRRERPEFFDANGGPKGWTRPTHLFTGVLHNGHARTHVQAIAGA